MSPADEADRQIAKLELELATIQHEETTPLQIEANLKRERLGATLATAAAIATAAAGIIANFASDFERSVERLADEINGRDHL